ncbi:MAG: ATP cone domain-containing protein, partial [Vagococcus sp.]
MIEIDKKKVSLTKESAVFNNVQVIKRDGRVTEFDATKITNALLKAEQKINGNATPHSEA